MKEDQSEVKYDEELLFYISRDDLEVNNFKFLLSGHAFQNNLN